MPQPSVSSGRKTGQPRTQEKLSQGRARRSSAPSSPCERILYLLALTLGLRRGELLGLRWEDVDLERKVVIIQRAMEPAEAKLVESSPKTAGSRATLPLLDFVVESLKERRKAQFEERLKAGPLWNELGYVFTTAVGLPIPISTLQRSWRRVLARAGLQPVRFHALRHTCASLLLMNGVSLRVVQQVLRHSRINLTADLYGHLTLEVTRQALEVMEGFATKLSPKLSPKGHEPGAV